MHTGTNYRVTSAIGGTRRTRSTPEQHPCGRIIGRKKAETAAVLSPVTYPLKAVNYVVAASRMGLPSIADPEMKAIMTLACKLIGIRATSTKINDLAQALSEFAYGMGCKFAIDKNDRYEKDYFLCFYRECETSCDFIHVSVDQHLYNLQWFGDDNWRNLIIDLYRAIYQTSQICFHQDHDTYVWDRLCEMANPEYWNGSRPIDNDEQPFHIDYVKEIDSYESGKAYGTFCHITKGKKINIKKLIRRIEKAKDVAFKNDALELAKLCLDGSRFTHYDYFPHRYAYDDGCPAPLFEQVAFFVDVRDLYYKEAMDAIDSFYGQYGQEVPHTYYIIRLDHKTKIDALEIKKAVQDSYPDKFYNNLHRLIVKLNRLGTDNQETIPNE